MSDKTKLLRDEALMRRRREEQQAADAIRLASQPPPPTCHCGAEPVVAVTGPRMAPAWFCAAHVGEARI